MNIKRVWQAKIRNWADEHSWLLVKELSGVGVEAFSGCLTYVCPSGNIINFALNFDGECVDIYEGRRQAE